MGVKAMYPGTFDPITLGHEDLVRRGLAIFDRVVVAVAGDSGGKAPMFSQDERVEMAEIALKDYDRVDVVAYKGLTIEYAQKNGLKAIVRGLRAVSDFEYEFQLANMNRRLTEEVETLFLTPTETFNFISSSLVREVASLGGDISEFLSPEVHDKLIERLKQDS